MEKGRILLESEVMYQMFDTFVYIGNISFGGTRTMIL
jgi:hypothetical protein